MTEYFLDTSALLKRYIVEAGTPWIRATTSAQSGHELHIAQITLVEIIAAANRRHREGSLTASYIAQFDTLFQQHVRLQYNVVRFTLAVIRQAQSLTHHYPLRAYDSVQLASALHINRQIIADGGIPMTFVCADSRLLAIAAAEGLAVLDPNTT